MIIIYDINGNVINNMGTNKMFPDGNIPNIEEILNEDEYIWKVHDDSEIAQRILGAKDYTIVFENGVPVDVNVTKTMEQYIIEQNQIPNIPTRDEINAQVVQKIRQVYSIDDEFQMQRFGLIDDNNAEYLDYLQYVSDCVEWGVGEKAKLITMA